MAHTRLAVVFALAVLGACSSSSSTEYEIVPATTGGTLTAVAGDGLALSVVEKTATGTTSLPSGTTVTWTTPSTVAALAPGATTASPLPAPGATATGTFITNATRPDITDDISGVLFVLDPGTSGTGTLEVSATVSADPSKPVTASIAVSATPAGDATRGQGSYLADCSNCHGQTGDGTMIGSDGMYEINGAEYPYPAEGLNKASNVAGSSTWSAALLAFASRADVNNKGVALRTPMPSWLADLDETTQKPPTTQELADIYAYLAATTQ
jgi:mono/diheme cytochrome c family protein